MSELNPRAWIPSFNRYATGFDNLYYNRQMNGVGEWWCYPAGEDEPVDVEIEIAKAEIKCKAYEFALTKGAK